MTIRGMLRRFRLPVSASAEQVVFGLPAPAGAVCLVGDIHGRADLLECFLSLRQRHFSSCQLIILGDMIDRGPDSAGVISMLRDEVLKGAVCLKGNHEDMMLAALDQPEQAMERWLRNGGLETVLSYMGKGHTSLHAPVIREAIGADVLDWVAALPAWWRSGSLVAVHAGLDPALSPESQEERGMLWGHPDFMRRPRRDGLWVAHGHVVVDRAFHHQGVIALDTGAWHTGRLSYALVDPALPEGERIVIGSVSMVAK